MEAEQFIAGSNEIHAGGATAESDEVSVQLHLVEVEKIQVAIAEANSGKHGIVVAVDAVSGDV